MISTEPRFQNQVAGYQAARQRRRLWYKIVSALACVVVFFTTYALILPAITMERVRVLACPLAVHSHTEDCYDADGNLTCGQADFVVHIHTDDCYDSDGNLVCTLPEIAAHTHSDECYAEERALICGETEDPGHEHTEACYTWTQALTCQVEEDPGHQHGEDCWDWEMVLTCEETERPEGHIHTDECCKTERVLTCAREEVILHTHTDACYEEVYDEDGALLSGELTCGQLEILEHAHTDDCFTDPDEGVMPLSEDNPMYLWLHVRDVEGNTQKIYDNSPWSDDESMRTGITDMVTMNGDYLIPVEYFETYYGDYGYTFDETDTGSCPFSYLPDAADAVSGTVDPGKLVSASYSYMQMDALNIDGWYVVVKDTGDYSNANYTAPRTNIYYTTYNTAEVGAFRLWMWARDSSDSNYEKVAAYDGNDALTNVLQIRKLDDTATNSYLIPIRYFEENYADYAYTFYAGSCPITYDPDATTGGDEFIAAGYVQADKDWYVMVQDTGRDTYGDPPRCNVYYTTPAQTNSFVWTYGGYSITFYVVDESGNPLYGDYSYADAELDDGIKVVFGDEKGTTGSEAGEVWSFPLPEIEGRVYSGAKLDSCSSSYSAASVATAGYVNCNGGTFTGFQFYGTEPMASGNWYTRNTSQAVYLIYTEPIEAITNTVSPSGTVINLFDYWVTENRIENDVSAFYDSGINSGHALKFTPNGLGSSLVSANKFTQSAQVFTGIVNNTLTNGYPTLTNNAVFGTDNNGTLISGGSESLAYLFDPTVSSAYKASYRNVTGLLQVDENGYYCYNSKENYAEFHEETNHFTLYNTWGVQYSGDEGMFFPFDKYEDVGKTASAGSDSLNHYFGLSLTTRFVQQHDGYTNSLRETPMQFSFSGDDDVWIFIDDVLAADLGGIHSSASVTIDFVTGTITVNGEVVNTLYDVFDAAGRAGDIQWSTDADGNGHSDTFANNTYHTLKFYYLERGSYASHLKLQYNLHDYPPTSVYKVNQYGVSVPGAAFAVYAANDEYKYLVDNSTDCIDLSGYEYTVNEKTGLITLGDGRTITARYVGTTDKKGEMVFVDADAMPYTLKELGSMFGTHFVLKEIKIPDGYRIVSDDVQLYIYNNQFLLCDNTYKSGVFAHASVQVTAPSAIRLVTGETVEYYDVDTGQTNGTLFAAVLKYVGQDAGNASAENLAKQANWKPLYGTDEKGYTLVDVSSYGSDFVRAAAYAVSKYEESAPIFALSAGGNLTATINGLPGEILNYYAVAQNKADTQYTVAYYWTSLDLANGTADWTDLNSSNTTRVDADANKYTFDRTFGAVINVPNLVNRLVVQKLDENGSLINGAAFALYKVNEVDGMIYYVAGNGALIGLDADEEGDHEGTARLSGGETGTYRIDSDTGKITVNISGSTCYITPVDTTVTTSAQQNGIGEDGTADFTNMDDGYYYLREIAAPAGYTLNSAEVMVLVDETAVYANAGATDDGVTVGRGPGYVVSTLDNFASQGQIDNTLSWVCERLLVSGISASFRDVYTAWKDDGTPAWHYLTENYSTALTSDVSEALTTYLAYDKGGSNTLFNYTINTDRYAEDTPNVTRRLYTDVGWSYYLLYQDYEYGTAHAATGANYTDLSGQEISNLFSRSTFVRVTDKWSSGTLELSKTAVPANGTEYSFTVNLYEAEGMDTPLADTYDYTVYTVNADGTRTEVTDSAGKVTGGAAAITLKSGQMAVINGLPYGTGYTITENGVGASYAVLISTNGGDPVDGPETSGTLTWGGLRTSNVYTVDYTNAQLPLLLVKKVDGGNTARTLAGASFVLYRTVESEGTAYYDDGAWTAPENGKTEADYAVTTGADGELLFVNLRANGTYYLEELSAPDGYHKLTSPITFTVYGNKITVENGTGYTAAIVENDAGDELTLVVENQPGFELPETGGAGAFPYTIGGTLLMACGLLCGYLLRRKVERRSAR